MRIEAQKRARAKNRGKGDKQLSVTLRPEDQDIADWLEKFAKGGAGESKAQYVRRLIREDMKRMKWVSHVLPVDERSAPYGYRSVDGKLEIVPEEAERIREAMDYFLNDGER